jgi:hypothetical protein
MCAQHCHHNQDANLAAIKRNTKDNEHEGRKHSLSSTWYLPSTYF